MLLMNNACVVMLLSNVFVFSQVIYVLTYCSERFINRDLRSEFTFKMSVSGTTSTAAVDPRHLKVQVHVPISPICCAKLIKKHT